MPQLNDFRKEVKYNMKSIEGGEILFHTELLAGDLEYVQGSPEDSDILRTLRTFEKLIKDWNLTDDKNEKLPIILDNIRKLSISDLTQALVSLGITDNIANITEKKNMK